MSNDAASREIDQLQHQIFKMSNTIEALKRRCIELEFEIVDHMAAAVAVEAEGILRGQAESELSDGSDS